MTQISRRALLAGASIAPIAAACASVNSNASEPQSTSPSETPFIIDVDRAPTSVTPLWPAGAPGLEAVSLNEHYVSRENAYGLPDRAIREVTNPTVSYFPSSTPNGKTILLIPGGGYSHVVVEKEGFEGARYFNQFGYDAYVMNYRLPHQGWPSGPDTPLQDAQRAIRTVRRLQTERRGTTGALTIIGFSAGGHVAGSVTQRYDADVYAPVDEIDELSARPDLSVLVYPVALMGSEFTHQGSQTNLLGDAPTSDALAKYDLAHAPNPDGPPVFMLHSLQDQSVPAENTLTMASAYRKAGIPAVVHVFDKGAHGFGLRGLEGTPLAAWPRLVMDWISDHS